ncbi:TetR/AcrR family transcriptional regulator [Pseudonocardia kongjuensis]|uniref:TetR/AcrR family transcriptional regulator n=1 Tax=Pseudonocardia kongjuensis TaxID=102227 RepID=A0ABP4I8G1_9PSEU
MPPPARPLRADAVRNRTSLLAAAEIEFAQRGSDASIADIAERAGVAKGTVFRHFATKDELVAAVVGGRFTRLAAVADRLLDSPDPGAALLEFLSATAESLHRQDLAFLQTVSEGDPGVAGIRERLHAAAEALVGRARDAGAVRPDVTGTDVLLLVCATVHAVHSVPDPAPDRLPRYLEIITDGLRHPSRA